MWRGRLVYVVGGMASAVALAQGPGAAGDFAQGGDPELSPLAEVCQEPGMPESAFCFPGANLERWLREGRVRLLEGAVTARGTQPGMMMRSRVSHPDLVRDLIISLAWRPAPSGWDAPEDSPRKELAAYALQKLFLDEVDWIVPVTVSACMPMAPGRPLLVGRAGEPHTDCVVGLLTYWLPNVEVPSGEDAARWEGDYGYLRAFAIFDLFRYVFAQRDTSEAGWLVSRDAHNPRVASVEHSRALRGGVNTPRVGTWAGLEVSALPRDVVARLRQVTDGELYGLATLDRWQVAATGEVSRGADDGLAIALNKGVRRRDAVVEVGLTARELRLIRLRILRLLSLVDSGEIGLF